MILSISLIKVTKEKGLPLDFFSPEVQLEEDPEHTHFFSVKSDEIIKDTDSRKLYARIVVAVELLQKQGIHISRRIISRDKVLYVTYEFPCGQDDFWGAFNKVWDDDQRK